MWLILSICMHTQHAWGHSCTPMRAEIQKRAGNWQYSHRFWTNAYQTFHLPTPNSTVIVARLGQPGVQWDNCFRRAPHCVTHSKCLSVVQHVVKKWCIMTSRHTMDLVRRSAWHFSSTANCSHNNFNIHCTICTICYILNLEYTANLS